MAAQPSAPDSFETLALAIFRYQAAHNPVYGAYLRYLNVRPEQITDLRRVPFLPIGFFKNHSVLTGFGADSERTAKAVASAPLLFASSGTTAFGETSRHYVFDSELYNAVSTRIFARTYGSLRNVHILALLPSYLERNNSSLVYMVQRFMDQTGQDQSDFFLHNHDALTKRLQQLTAPGQRPAGGATVAPKRILLIGVTFALLDWADSGYDFSFLNPTTDLIVMETGGMKGRRRELLREEVHQILTERLPVSAVHSEYGMTELLSQAYSTGEGVFRPSPTLRVLLRDTNDPFHVYAETDAPAQERRTGGINVVDLANLDSCSFIETGDLGQYVGSEGAFRVIGRFDNSDVRGCNLMVP